MKIELHKNITKDFSQMDQLSLEELQKKAQEYSRAAQDNTQLSQQCYREIQHRFQEEMKKDISDFRKDADKFITTVMTLDNDMSALKKRVLLLESKYGQDAFTDDERRLFYSMELGAVFFKGFQLTSKKQ